MSFEKARISLDYLNNHVTEDIAGLTILSKMPKATINLNLQNLTQQGTVKRKYGSGRPRALNHNVEKSVSQKTLTSPL